MTDLDNPTPRLSGASPAKPEWTPLTDAELADILADHNNLTPGEYCSGDGYDCGYLRPCPIYRMGAELTAIRQRPDAMYRLTMREARA